MKIIVLNKKKLMLYLWKILVSTTEELKKMEQETYGNFEHDTLAGRFYGIWNGSSKYTNDKYYGKVSEE